MHTQAGTHTPHLANPDLSRENRPPAHAACDPAAVTNSVLRLGIVTPFFAAGPTHLNFCRMSSLTWTPAGSRGCSSAALCSGRLPSPQFHYAATRSPGSPQRNAPFVPEEQRTAMPVPLALTHREMLCRQRRRASLSASAGALGSRSILPCQPRRAPGPAGRLPNIPGHRSKAEHRGFPHSPQPINSAC